MRIYHLWRYSMIQKRCNKPGCIEYIPRNKKPAYCAKHTQEIHRVYDKTREPRIVAFYNSKKWRDLRQSVLAEHHYMCVPCKAEGKLTAADTVHHVIELRDDWSKRLDRANCMPVCRTCHNLIHEKLTTNH